MTRLSFLISIVYFLFATASESVLAERYNNITCDISPGRPLINAYGPYDFTNPDHADKLPIVLGAHFPSQVEQLIAGNRGSIIADINYTLKAIPNYHRALAAMAKYQRREHLKLNERDQYYTADCYFRRAIYFQPTDATSRMLFAIHLQLTGRKKDAEKLYKESLSYAPDYTESQYNYGLLLVELNRYDEALQLAEKAYANGFPLPGLKNKLAKKGFHLDSEILR